MKKIFSLEVTEDDGHDALEPYINGLDWKIVVSELDAWLRNLAKYEDVELVKVETVREKIRELTSDSNLTF